MIRETHHVSLPRYGERVNGDAVVVRDEGSTALLSVVDALGHGVKAADVARRATEELLAVPLSQGPLFIIDRLHEKLRRSRGAAALICIVKRDPSGNAVGIETCSVGNVAMRCQSSKPPFMLTPGVIGARVRAPRVLEGSLVEGDRIVLFSDGISPRFSLDDFRVMSPFEVCQAIIGQHRRHQDDATVLVADLEANHGT